MLKNNKVYNFYLQVKQEAKKITWLPKKELFYSTTVVLVVVLMVSIICVIIDFSIHNVLRLLLMYR